MQFFYKAQSYSDFLLRLLSGLLGCVRQGSLSRRPVTDFTHKEFFVMLLTPTPPCPPASAWAACFLNFPFPEESS